MNLKPNIFAGILLMLVISGCDDDPVNLPEPAPLTDANVSVSGYATIKTLACGQGFMALHETLQTQLVVTIPKREIAWLRNDLSEISRFIPTDGWTLIDAVTHPSGQTSAVSVKVTVNPPIWTQQIKLTRFNADGMIITEFELTPLPLPSTPELIFVASLDRLRLAAFDEDVFVTARWQGNEVQAYRLSFVHNQFIQQWVKWVEPSAFLSVKGIIGGGFDNFHQGDYYLFVYSDVDQQGNLYVAVSSTEEVLTAHDAFFDENLMTSADPSNYEYGVAIVTKFSPNGDRISSKLIGDSFRGNKHMLNMRVNGNGEVYLIGRIKFNSQQSNGWDAWLLAADPVSGTVKYDNRIDIRDGDMFWDVLPLPNGNLLGVGSTGYTQNPAGLSVSDMRSATAVLLSSQGILISEINLPQGPAGRGNEAMSVNLLGSRNVVISGIHNAPGTHAAVYSDGFVAVRFF